MKTFLSLTFLVGLSLAEPPSYRQFQQNKQVYYVAPENQEVNSGPYEPSGWKPKGPAFNLPEKQTAENSYGPPKQQYGAPSAPPKQQYGAPSAPPKQQYGAPSAPPKQQYGAPSAPPKQQYGAPSTPQRQQFGASSAPQQQYGAPAVPQKQYIPQKQYASPPQNYGPPNVPQEQYGVPEYTTTEQPGFDDEDEEPTTVRGLEESETESGNAANELDEEANPQQPQQTGEYYVALPDGRLQRVNYVSRQDAMKYFAKIRAENVEPLRGPIYAYAPLQKIELSPQSGLEVAVSPALVVPHETKSDFNAKLSVQPIAQVQYQLENTGSYSNYNANYQTNDPRFIVAP